MDKKEIWRDVKGYEGLYQISNIGRVKSLSRTVYRADQKPLPVKEKILKFAKDKDGYLIVCLHSMTGKQKNHKVHRLVAEAFIDKVTGKTLINHKDGIKSNNFVDNLEWCDNSDNILHSYYTLGNLIKPVRCVETGQTYPSVSDCGRQNDVDGSWISQSCRNGIACKGQHYEYIN